MNEITNVENRYVVNINICFFESENPGKIF